MPSCIIGIVLFIWRVSYIVTFWSVGARLEILVGLAEQVRQRYVVTRGIPQGLETRIYFFLFSIEVVTS